MDINSEKSIVIQEFQQINDISLVRAIRHMIHYALKQEGRISIEQYNKELEEAENRIDQNEFFTQAEVEKMIKKW